MILFQSDIKQAIVSQQQQSSNTQIVKDITGKTYISPILDHSGSRKRQDTESDFVPEYCITFIDILISKIIYVYFIVRNNIIC